MHARARMRVAAAAAFLFFVGNTSGFDYKNVYETLYSKAGYHAGTRDTHGIPLVHNVERTYNKEVSSVLDVGCSHGDVVARFWRLGCALPDASGRCKMASTVRCTMGQSHCWIQCCTWIVSMAVYSTPGGSRRQTASAVGGRASKNFAKS